MNLKKRSLIFVTFFLSCLAIALLGASLGTKVGKLLLLVELTSNMTMSSYMSSCVLVYFQMFSYVLIFR